MLTWYFAYVTFMKYNENIELAVKKRLYANRVDAGQDQRPATAPTSVDMKNDDTPSLPLPAKDSLHSQHAIQVSSLHSFLIASA
jgi:hypothetical protein